MSASRELRVALVGAGSMGRNHARVIAESRQAELVAVVEPVEAAGAPTAQRFGARWLASVDELTGVDAVVVAAPTEYHYDIALQLMDRQLPLLIEKPVSPSLAQTEELLRLSGEAEVPLMCGFLERFNPAITAAKRMIEDPVFIRCERHSPYVPRIRTGVAWDLLVHDVDLVTQFLQGQEPDSVSAQIGYFHPQSVAGAEDVVEAGLHFVGGAVASASASRIGQRKVRTMVLQSLDRTIEVDLLRRGVTSYRHTVIEAHDAGGGFRQSTEMEVPEVTGVEPLAAQFDRFMSLVRGEADAAAERRSILPAHRVIDSALAARPA